MNYDAFISYARRDGTPLVKKLVVGLRETGFRVFWDQDSIPAGANWEQTLDEALESATHILVVLTPFSVKSEEVAAEWRPMLARGKNIIPLLYLPCEVPRRLSMRQYINFQDEATYALALTELVEAMNSATGTTAPITLSGAELIQRGTAYLAAGQLNLAVDDYLSALASGDSSIRIQALRLLGKARRTDTIPKLLEMVQTESDVTLQVEMLETIRRIVELEDWRQTHPAIMAQVRPWLDADHAEIRRQAIRILAYGEDLASVPVIVARLLTDPAEIVRQQAALALGRLQTTEAQQGLMQGRADNRPAVRDAVALALKRYPN